MSPFDMVYAIHALKLKSEHNMNHAALKTGDICDKVIKGKYTLTA